MASTIGRKLAEFASKLSLPIPVTLGGTAKTTVAAFLTDLLSAGAYGKTNVVGSVTQTAGVPTGAVIETVTVSGGTAVKFADGTMILTLRHVVTRTLGTVVGGMVLTATQELGIAYGVTFVGIPNEHVTAMQVPSAAAIFWSSTGENTATTSGSGFMSALGSQASANYTIKRTAIGRWF